MSPSRTRAWGVELLFLASLLACDGDSPDAEPACGAWLLCYEACVGWGGPTDPLPTAGALRDCSDSCEPSTGFGYGLTPALLATDSVLAADEDLLDELTVSSEDFSCADGDSCGACWVNRRARQRAQLALESRSRCAATVDDIAKTKVAPRVLTAGAQ